jgi:hypothetical protein
MDNRANREVGHGANTTAANVTDLLSKLEADIDTEGWDRPTRLFAARQMGALWDVMGVWTLTGGNTKDLIAAVTPPEETEALICVTETWAYSKETADAINDAVNKALTSMDVNSPLYELMRKDIVNALNKSIPLPSQMPDRRELRISMAVTVNGDELMLSRFRDEDRAFLAPATTGLFVQEIRACLNRRGSTA